MAAASSACVCACWESLTTSCTSPCSLDTPIVHNGGVIGKAAGQAQVMRDEQIADLQRLPQIEEQIHNLPLNRQIQTAIDSSRMTIFGLRASARAIARRCLCPPLSSDGLRSANCLGSPTVSIRVRARARLSCSPNRPRMTNGSATTSSAENRGFRAAAEP